MRHDPDDARPGPDLDAAALMRRARRLRFRVRPRSTLALAGAYHAARPGAGLTFAELKPYEPGDDVRHLDWNVTARQGRPYVRRYVEERSLLLWLVVDVSGSLRCGPSGRSRADRAAQAAALLAAAAVQNGDRVGLTLVSDRIEADVPPGSGARHLARVLRALVVAPPAAARGTDLAAALPVARRRRARRRLMVLLSDFLTPPPAAPWRAALRGVEQVALRLVDPGDGALAAGAGLLALRDAESGRTRLVDAGSRRVRLAYARAATARAAGFRSWCEAVGASGHDLSTADDPARPLLRIMRDRARSRRR
jgi:uncharacterized protein (DUF58 family)